MWTAWPLSCMAAGPTGWPTRRATAAGAHTTLLQEAAVVVAVPVSGVTPREERHTTPVVWRLAYCKIQKNWWTATVAPKIEHHGGHSRTSVNQRWDQVPERSGVSCLASRTRHECPRHNESGYMGVRHWIWTDTIKEVSQPQHTSKKGIRIVCDPKKIIIHECNELCFLNW